MARPLPVDRHAPATSPGQALAEGPVRPAPSPAAWSPVLSAGDGASSADWAGAAALVGLWDLDVATGQVAADERVREMFGGLDPRRDVRREPFLARIHPADRSGASALMQRAIETCGSMETPYRVVWPDGTVRHLLGRGQAYPGPDGRAARVVGAAIDVTGLVELRAARLRAVSATASLVAVAQALGRAETEGDVLGVVTGLGVRVLSAEGAVLTLRDRDDQRSGRPLRPVRALTTAFFDDAVRARVATLPPDFPLPMVDVAGTGLPLYLPDRAAAVRLFPAAADLYEQASTAASAAVPLALGDRLLGSLSVAWTSPRDFDDDDVQLMASLATLCAQALDRLQAREAERAGARAALSLSEALQRSLLSSPPQPDHLQIAARYQPASERAQIGGDWHDAFASADRRGTWVVIGDVVGHDQTAAALMGQVRNMLRATVHALPVDPAAALQQLERTLSGLGVDALATAVLVRVAHEEVAGARTIVWCNAGHLPPLLLRQDRTVQVLQAEPDVLLGLEVAVERVDHRAQLHAGSTLLLYTDGLVERRGEDVEQGVERLRDALVAFGALPVEQLADALLRRLLPEGGEDDVALILVRAGRDGEP